MAKAPAVYLTLRDAVQVVSVEETKLDGAAVWITTLINLESSDVFEATSDAKPAVFVGGKYRAECKLTLAGN